MKHKSVDLSKKPNSFASYLIKLIPTIDKKSPDEVIQLLKDSKEHCSISDKYLEKIITTAEGLKHNKKMLLKYVADIALKGSELGVISNKELLKKLAAIYGSEDELLVRNLISKKLKVSQENNKIIMLDHSTQLILKPAQSIEEDPKGFIIEIKGDFQTDKEYKEIVSKVKELWKNFSDSIIID